MSGANPLVAEAEQDAGPFANMGGANDVTNGLKVVDAGADAADAFARGDWIEGSVNGLSAGIDTVGALIDPIGTIGSSIAGWLMEHLSFVQDALDELCGDPGAIMAASTTWHNVAGRLGDVSGDYAAAAAADMGGQQGLAVEAYAGFAGAQADVVRAMARIAEGVGAGVALAGTVVAGVRDFISNLTADAVGQIVKLFAESVLTLGFAAPHAVATAANKCRQLIQRARTFMEDLARSLDRMADLVGQVSPALETGASSLASGARRASAMNETELTLLVSGAKAPGQTDDKTPYGG